MICSIRLSSRIGCLLTHANQIRNTQTHPYSNYSTIIISILNIHYSEYLLHFVIVVVNIQISGNVDKFVRGNLTSYHST